MIRGARYFDRIGRGSRGRLAELAEMQWRIIETHVHLVASSSYPFDAVLRIMGEPSFVLGAEGLPGSRYLPGSAVMDIVEEEGEALLLRLFRTGSAYRGTLQPHSGTQANQIVYNAVLGPNDVALCLRPRAGGHISHTVLVGRRNRTISYGLTATGVIDYDHMRSLALLHRPKLIIVGGSALPRACDFAVCGEIAREAGALLHADISHTAALIAGGVHPPVFPYCDFATFNTVKSLRGPNGGLLIYRAEFADTVRNSIFPTTQGGPNETIMMGKFAALAEWRQRDISAYAQGIVRRGRLMADVLVRAGLSLVTNGTDSHLLLLQLGPEQPSGAALERRFEDAGVLLNKNLVPGDPRSPEETSGLRIGVTNLSILGYADDDLNLLSHWLHEMIVGKAARGDVIPYLTSKYRWSPAAEPEPNISSAGT